MFTQAFYHYFELAGLAGFAALAVSVVSVAFTPAAAPFVGASFLVSSAIAVVGSSALDCTR